VCAENSTYILADTVAVAVAIATVEIAITYITVAYIPCIQTGIG
jgi:hypothetical protein